MFEVCPPDTNSTHFMATFGQTTGGGIGNKIELAIGGGIHCILWSFTLVDE